MINAISRSTAWRNCAGPTDRDPGQVGFGSLTGLIVHTGGQLGEEPLDHPHMLGRDQPALLSVGDGGQRRRTRLAGQCPARPEKLGVAMRRRASPLDIRSRVASKSAGELPPQLGG